MFHAASAGEYEQIKPILRGINRSEFFIIQTFTSPTIYNVESVYGEDLYDIKCYHPFDIFWDVESFKCLKLTDCPARGLINTRYIKISPS